MSSQPNTPHTARLIGTRLLPFFRLSPVIRRIFLSSVAIIALIAGIFPPQSLVLAAPNLTITPITWNVVGLDSNNVNVGPNNFPLGARVCNTGADPALNVTSTFVWDTTPDPNYINIRPGTLSAFTGDDKVASLAAGTCHDFYYEIEVTRDSAAYDTTRRYHITATADTLAVISTPTPREIYVEHLISQSRNYTTDVKLNGVSIPNGGTMALLVGNTYTIQLIGKTATNGYNQIESFINFPNTIFQIQSAVSTTFTATDIGSPIDKLYGDACTWDNDPNSPAYRSCVGLDYKAGGDISVMYVVKIIGGAGTNQTLNNLIYDFSGSSYHYNSDFSVGSRIAAIIDPALVTISKNFSPDPTIVNGTSTLTFTLQNPNGVALSNINFSDTFPTSPGAMVVATSPAATTSGCGSPTFAPVAAAASISFLNGTIAANGSCTVSVNVSAPVTGTYNNTSGHLFIGSTDTGNTATDSLTVNTTPPLPACTAGLSLAQWNFDQIPAPNGDNPAASFVAGNVATASASHGTGIDPTGIHTSLDTGTGVGGTKSWLGYGFDQKNPGFSLANKDYFEFAVDTRNYSQVGMSFDVMRKSPGPITIFVYSSTTGVDPFSLKSTISTTTSYVNQTISFTGQTSTSGTTYFRLYGFDANNPNTGADVHLDNVSFTGCAVPVPPTITKSFSPNPIAVNGISILTFELKNTNNVILSGVAFTDDLAAAGLQVADPIGAGNSCGATFSPAIGATTLSFSGGSIPAKAGSTDGTCTAHVNVTTSTAGSHANVSGYISSTQTGTNTGMGGSARASLTALVPPVIRKSFSPNPILVDKVSVLTFTITNPNPNDGLSGVAFTDDLPLNLIISPPTASSQCGGTVSTSVVGSRHRITLTNGTLTAGGSCTITVSTISSSADSYPNTSENVSATLVGNGNTASDTLIVQPIHPSISLLKRVSTSPLGPWTTFIGVPVGASIYYQFTVENTGDVPLSSISVDDPTLAGTGVDPAACTWPSPLPIADSSGSEIATCIRGPVEAISDLHENTATAYGSYATVRYSSNPSKASYATTELMLDKNVTELYYAAAGDILHYSYLVTNNGFAPLVGPVTISDNKSPSVTCPNTNTVGDLDAFLDRGESLTCTATYTVTPGDVATKTVTNTAFATAAAVDSNIDSVTIGLHLPDLVITKSNNTSGLGTVGTPFTWKLTITNSGTLDGTFFAGQTIVSDPLPANATYGVPLTGNFINITNSGSINCSIDLSNNLVCIADGSTVTLGDGTGNFEVSFAVNPSINGDLENTATVDPLGSVNESIETNNSSTDLVVIGGIPGITLVKDALPLTYDTPGDIITYTYTITNSGNVDLPGPFIITDDKAGTNNPCGSGPLAPTETTSCTLTHSMVQGDLDAGSVTNIASASTTYGGNPVNSNLATQTVTAVQSAAITLEKEAFPVTYSAVGDLITYTYTITNSGNVTLSGPFSVSDDTTGIKDPCGSGPVAPNNTTSCQLTYSITQTDLDSGVVTNVATAATTYAGNPVISGPATETVNAIKNPAITLSKTALPITYSVSGEGITYTYTITNNGNVSLPGPFSVTDDKAGTKDPCGTGPLVPAASTSCDLPYLITQDDIDFGSVTNLASATTTFDGNTVDSNIATQTINADQNPVISVSKSSTTASITAAGQVVPYTFVVTNTGNMTLTGITVTDPNCSTAPTYQSGDNNTDDKLDLTETWNYTCSHNVTQAEVNAGGNLSNTVTADSVESLPDTDNMDIPISQTASLHVVKSSTTTTITAAGQAVPYAFTLTNTGNVMLTGITVFDPNCDANPAYQSGDINSNTDLELTETWSYICNHTVTQAEMDAGGNLSNTVTADSVESGPDTDDLNIAIIQTPVLNVEKNSTTVTITAAGQVVPYTFGVTNTGNINLTGIIVTDPNCSGALLYQSGDTNADGKLDFTETWNFTCSHVVIQSEVEAGGNLSNTVTADSLESGPDTDNLDIPITQTPALSLLKNVVEGSYSFVGEIIHYSFLVTNSGNVNLTGPIVLEDDQTTNENCPAIDSVGNFDMVFDVGESVTCTATHTVTLTNLQNGSITNNAIAHANYGGLVINSNTSQRTINTIAKTGDPSNLLKSLSGTDQGFTITPNVAIGEILTYEIQVYIPVGVFNNVIVTDNMDLGLAFIRCTGIASGGLITSEYGNDFSQICTHPSVNAIPLGDPNPENQGRRVIFDFGSISNTSEDQWLTITYEAVVLDNSANSNGTDLTNSVAFTSSSGALAPDDPSPTLAVVEPRLSISKTVDLSFVNIGSVVTYTLTIQHTGASLTPAFDTLVHDTLPADLLFLSVNCGLSSIAPTSCVGNAGTGDVDVVWNTFPMGATGAIAIQAQVQSIPASGQILNTANVEWTSLPGPVPGPLSPYNTLSSERWYDPGGSVVNDYGAAATLPIFLATQLKTGFSPGRFTLIGPIPSVNYYTPSNLELDIPSLNLEKSIVGVPSSSTGWDLTWLWNKVGWLEGTAYPTWLGNSVLTGHAYMPNGKPGPFMNIGQLIWGDQIIVHAYGTQYIYSVRSVALLPYDDQSYLSHSDQSTLTLVTCKSYDEEKSTYRWHVVVRAVLTSKVDDK